MATKMTVQFNLFGGRPWAAGCCAEWVLQNGAGYVAAQKMLNQTALGHWLAGVAWNCCSRWPSSSEPLLPLLRRFVEAGIFWSPTAALLATFPVVAPWPPCRPCASPVHPSVPHQAVHFLRSNRPPSLCRLCQHI